MSSAQRIAYDDALMTAETPTSTDVVRRRVVAAARSR